MTETAPIDPPLDPRLHAFRPDRADAALRGRVKAAAFVAGQPGHVISGHTSMRRSPSIGAMQTSELLHGETVQVFDRADGWCWVQNRTDGYVGYVRESSLAEGAAPAPDHWVCAMRTPVFLAPEVKAPVLDFLSLTAEVAVCGETGAFAELADGGWVFQRHLARLDDRPADPVAQAARFLGLPYVWGGRSSAGVDCSGLVQLSLAACGVTAPRDSDMQQAEIGAAVSLDPTAALQRGDIVFFPGHVGFMVDAHTLLHATAHSLQVCEEPLAAVADRAVGADGTRGVTAVRRLQR